MSNPLMEKMLDLPEFEVTDFKQNDNDMGFYVETKKRPTFCLVCGCYMPNLVIYKSRKQTVRDIYLWRWIMAFKERLKEAREAKGFTQQKLANLVGVSKSAIANYETGVSSAKEQVLIRLFDALDIEPNFLWQDEIAENAVNFACSLPEKEIIKKYRALDEHGKKIIDLVLEELNSRDEAEKSNTIQIDLYDLSASTGIGEPIEGGYRTLIEVPDTAWNRNADFCVRVSGDSMEPTFLDGNIVLVKKGQVHIGDVGIFILDGERFIKELGEGKLISHNSKYSDLRLEDFSNIYIAGKVIGVI